MDYKSYQEYANVQGALDIRKENVIEILQLFVLISNIQKLTFMKYDFKYNNFVYGFTIDGYEIIEDDINFINNKYSIVLKDGDIIFGKITFNRRIWYRQVLRELLKKSKIALRKIFEIEKDLLSQNTPLNVYIITDKNTIKFANKLQTNLDILLNAEISVIHDITKINEPLNLKNSKNIIIYTVQNNELIKDDEELLKTFNEFIIVVGPNDHNLSLTCGKLNIENYVSIDEFSPEHIKNIILDTKHKLINKNKLDNKIIAVSGVSGGIGATTISMNTADIIARKNPSKNVLYVDLSTTKAISNLFLSQNPVPNYTIIDLVNMSDFNIQKNLEVGLVKIRENFYSINGIQKHIDKDLVEKDNFIEKLLDYLLKASENFNYIIIDTGEADASSMKSTIYDLVNEIWILTEMTLPHVSKLKTFYSLMKRAGLKDKVSFIVNRVNSLNEISASDFDSIMNTSSKEEKLMYLKIPNDYATLGKCWNYCELASEVSKDSIFVKTLEEILLEKEYISNIVEKKKNKKALFSFLNKEKS
ncbi:AAA family ATPase [Arcobacter sp. LA11]|uniref:AAA family ATPase n=1 Tax=Arcobacter sp. LA11 TaxID=1898176 RepID=UPI00093216BC|nr:AAA family ATPase [Arcobacter sp. LA11]